MLTLSKIILWLKAWQKLQLKQKMLMFLFAKYFTISFCKSAAKIKLSDTSFIGGKCI